MDKDKETIILKNKDFDKFLEVYKKPNKPNQALKDAVKFSKKVGK